jgi:hypothetical protein
LRPVGSNCKCSRGCSPCSRRAISRGTVKGHVSNDVCPATNIEHENEKWIGQVVLNRQRAAVRPFVQAAPGSCFKKLPTMRPELYTCEKSESPLSTFFSHQISATESTRVTEFSTLYRRAPGEWTRLRLTLTISVESPYWLYPCYRSSVPYSKGRHSLMKPVAASLCDALEEMHCDNTAAPLGQDMHLGMYLGSPDEQKPLSKCLYIKTSNTRSLRRQCSLLDQHHVSRKKLGKVQSTAQGS